MIDIIALLVFVVLNDSQTTPCDLRFTKYGSVCVCNTTYCDYLMEPTLPNNESVIVVSSTKEGLRFSLTNGAFGSNEALIIKDFSQTRARSDNEHFDMAAVLVEDDGQAFAHMESNITLERFFLPLLLREAKANLAVDREKKYQKINGFGGAFTGAVSYLIQNLKPQVVEHIYKSFFHDGGIKFNILRTSIGGCDFDLEPWAYNEEPQNDIRLTNFTKLDWRDEIKVEQIKQLKEIANITDLKIMAAAWSAPKWMKTNNDWTGLGFLKREYYQTWADYHLRFLDLMDSKNMPIWAISTGNEPLNGFLVFVFVHFMSMGWTPSQQAIWLSEHLGPTIKNSKHKDVMIFGNDDQRSTYPEWFRSMKRTRSNSLDYLDGLAVHWYLDQFFAPTLIDAAVKDMPGKVLFNTEACVGDKPWQTHGPELGSWERGDLYIKSLMQDFQHSFNGFIDWNIILNEEGGPNYVRNFVDAPVIVNTTAEEIYKQPIFYVLGHFSKFILPGSVRISTKISNIYADSVGFKRPDGSIVIILSNSGRLPMEISLKDTVRGDLVFKIPGRSIHTLVYN